LRPREQQSSALQGRLGLQAAACQARGSSAPSC
jgi:hypothetical protein